MGITLVYYSFCLLVLEFLMCHKETYYTMILSTPFWIFKPLFWYDVILAS